MNLVKKLKEIDKKKFCVDTAAMIVFSFIYDGPRELLSGLTMEQMLATRISGIPIDIALGGTYGLYNDLLRKKAHVLEVDGFFNKERAIRSGVDMFAFTTFFAPIYAGLLYYWGVEGKEIVSAVGSAVALMPISGPLYGIFNEYSRKLFHVKDGKKEKWISYEAP